MTTPAARLLVALAVAAVAQAAHAQSAPAAAPASEPAAAAPARPAEVAPRVRASHQVDVVAPGERVDTIIDRLRAGQPAPSGGARPQVQGGQEGVRDGGPHGAGKSGAGMGPHAVDEGPAAGAAGGMPPPTGGGMPTAPGGTMPGMGGEQPERHRR